MKNKKYIRIFMILVVIFFLYFLFYFLLNKGFDKRLSNVSNPEIRDSFFIVKNKDKHDSLIKKKEEKTKDKKSMQIKSVIKAKQKHDSLVSIIDTPEVKDDTVKAQISIIDTLPPYVYAIPGQGIHHEPIKLKLICEEKKSEINYKLHEKAVWQKYKVPFYIEDTLKIFYRAKDSVGNMSRVFIREYLIDSKNKNKCPDDMVFVESGKNDFCIDKYEWPNKKDTLPLSYINWYMAYDSCRTYNKRLCSADEWEKACTGKKDWQYPYGNKYEIKTCNTESNNTVRSGSYPECRSFFGAYDMSGNLREWTSTKSKKNNNYYKVYGGFWESRGASKCDSYQYSFYPQNKFISIGFRCCKDALDTN